MAQNQNEVKFMVVGPVGDQASDNIINNTSTSCAESDIRSLAHPRYPDRSVKYMIRNSQILEIQQVEPMRFSSFFFGQSVESNGAIFVATRIDPCFLLLPLLRKGARKFSLLSQILTSAESDLSSLVNTIPSKLERICDVKDLDEDGMFYRINDAKVIGWLKAKVDKLSLKLCAVEATELAGASGDGFAAGFSLGVPTTKSICPISSEGTVRGVHIYNALEMVCEYLDDEMAEVLRSTYSECEVLKGFNIKSGEKRQANEEKIVNAKWKSDVDEMTTLAYGQPKKAKLDGPGISSNQTAKNKSLAKAPPKGMKSMASYFQKK